MEVGKDLVEFPELVEATSSRVLEALRTIGHNRVFLYVCMRVCMCVSLWYSGPRKGATGDKEE